MRYAVAIAVVMAACAAHAAEPLVINVDKPVEKKFIPLNNDVEKQNGVSILKEKKFMPLQDKKSLNSDRAMNSDRQQMNNGFMRLDRNRLAATPLQHTLLKPDMPSAIPADKPAEAAPTPAANVNLASTVSDANPGALEPDSEEIEGNTEGANPVLALFGAGDTTPSSFRDAMSGRSTGSFAGLAKQIGWPLPLNVKQSLTSGYGMRPDPFNGRPSFHGGIDIAADMGTPVLATGNGQVMQATHDANYGNYITLAHADGTLTRYGHLSAEHVHEGDYVKAGDVIGAVGATGRATGPHLDYRVSKNGMKFDPLAVLTVPANVPVKAGTAASLAVAVRRGNPVAVASNPVPKRPMVIKVQ